MIGPVFFQKVGQLGESVGGVSGQANVGFQVVEAVLGQGAECGTATGYGRVAATADALDYLPGNGEGRLGVDVAAVVQVADGDANQLGLKLPDSGLGLGQVIVGEHQVQHPQGVMLRVDVGGYVGQSNGQGSYLGAAHPAVVAVGSNQQDTHTIHLYRNGERSIG